MFAVGDSSRNLREGDAFSSTEFKDVADAIFGYRKPIPELGKYNGAGKSGFSVCSCQFALHYFFKNAQTLHGFLRNVAENTQMGGYFIGTTYDGDTVFKRLRKSKKGEGIVLSKDEKIYFQLLRGYDETGFPPDESSLGYSIHVFQESIGKMAEEYLVNFTFFENMMKLYGFRLADPDIDRLDLPRGSGLFEELYDDYSEKNAEEVEEEFVDESFVAKDLLFFLGVAKFERIKDNLVKRTIAKLLWIIFKRAAYFFRRLSFFFFYLIFNPWTLQLYLVELLKKLSV
jgi:hypothetical protein